ncbi:MAG TPA: class I SAM-dependent methyltransferase, partial [Chthoniobacterales bacterium]
MPVLVDPHPALSATLELPVKLIDGMWNLTKIQMPSNMTDRMRAEWNVRAREDAHFYVAFGRRHQIDADFEASASDVLPALEQEFHRLPVAHAGARRALEIGCGPGRLLLPMSRYFSEIHGVDVSDEMIGLARERLRDTHVQVHATSGQDLAIFADEYFDFVYSYIVFQHIPERETVLNYLRESQRVLKPGGVLRCQIRGIAPPPSEMFDHCETWTGCFFTAAEICRFAQEHAFPLVTLSGVDTQYMWTTFRKPEDGAPPIPVRLPVIKGITATSGSDPRVPNRGRGAAVSLWMEGMPDSASVADFDVLFDEHLQIPCYLSPVSESGGCQYDA